MRGEGGGGGQRGGGGPVLMQIGSKSYFLCN